MKSFEEISKMNLAELDRPAGAGEEELETETTGAAGNHSVSDAEKAGTPGADDLETSINSQRQFPIMKKKSSQRN